MSIARRDLLSRVARLAGTAALARATLGAQSPPGRKLKVIVTGGHPGDPEYGCGGTIARYADLGYSVVLLYLNDGVPTGKPKDGVRVAESGRACDILGARPLF